MEKTEYLRNLAAQITLLAEGEPDPAIKARLLDLAARCEKIANEFEGNGIHHGP